MPIKITNLVLLFFILSIRLASAQEIDKPANQQADQLYIHVDKPFYTNGENIWYKVYILNDGPSTDFSKVIHVDLISSKGKPIMQQKLKVKERTAYGDFNLPLDTEEGYYYLRAYTRWNKNFETENNYVLKLPVYNEWLEKTVSSMENDIGGTLLKYEDSLEQLFKVSISAVKASYKPNEVVTFDVQIVDRLGKPVKANLLIKVTDNDLIHDTGENDIFIRKSALRRANFNSDKQNQYKYAKEEGLKIQGTVLDPSTEEPYSTRFLSIYVPGISDFNFYAIDEGVLDKKLPDFYGTQTLQFHNFNPYETTIPKVIIDEKINEWSFQSVMNEVPERSPEIDKYLHYARLRRKINEVFEISVPDDLTIVTYNNANLKADKVFWMKNYHTLKDVEEFIRTFFFKVRFKESDGKTSVRLFNDDSQKNFMESPWYLLNGYLTRDENFLLKMSLKDVEKIEMFYRNNTLSSQFNPFLIRSGVVAIHTKEKGLIKPKLDPQNNKEVLGFYQSRKFPLPLKPEKKHQNPDFRPLVYWNPEIITDNEGKATVSFPASSAIGSFKIEVEGITPHGELIKGFHEFTVQ